MNYYHESMGYVPRTDAEINTDLDIIDKLVPAGDKKYLKIYYNPYNADNLANCKNICEIAKHRGYYVVWTENNDNTELTTEGWSTYSSLVVADSAEAEDSGADEFLVGNEISIHNDESSMFADGNLETAIKGLITACGSSFTGLYGYEEGWWKAGTWYSSGLGNLNKIYLTLYESWADFQTHAADIYTKFGGSAVIGEYSDQSTFEDTQYVTHTEASWASSIYLRTQFLRDLGFRIFYPFTFYDSNEGGGYGHYYGSNRTKLASWDVLSTGNR